MSAPPISRSMLPLPVFLKQLKDSQENPQSKILQHWLGRRLQYAPATLDNAVIVGLDAEWFERGNGDITELGISVIDTKQIPEDAGPWEVLAAMQVMHVRIKENAHMVNTKKCPGRPDKFQFGETRFLSMDEARQFLVEVFTPTTKTTGGEIVRRPVVFVGHAVENDAEMMNRHFGVDINALGTVATTIDTQALFRELPTFPYWLGGRNIGLKDLLASFALQEEFLHTAGNDIAYTTIAAFLLADPALSTAMYDPCHTLSMEENQPRVEQLKSACRKGPRPQYGVSVFCTRCDSTEHAAGRCNVEVHCEKCAKCPKRNRYAHTHKTEKCGIIEQPRTPPVVVPCEHCVLCPDPKRWQKANTHTTEECFFAPGKKKFSWEREGH